MPSLDLVEFVEQQILPKYQKFDRAHSTQHAQKVIRCSLLLASKLGADLNMAYVIAAYHDLGLSGPRAKHHITGARILLGDQRLRRWFSEEQLRIMAQAVEDHRASASRSPRSLYGRIVAEADRDMAPESVIERTVFYGLDHYPHLSREEQWERFCAHLEEKYSSRGYIRLWIPGSENEKHLQQLRSLMEQPVKLKQAFDEAYERLNNK